MQFDHFCAAKDVSKQIFDVTNEAFMADAFFKKEQYYARFECVKTVEDMMDRANSEFLCICSKSTEDKCIAGSIYLQWEIEINDNENESKTKISVTGHVSCVSVGKKFERKGIGKRLVAAAEEYLLLLLPTISTTEPIDVAMEIGVINLRTDLFPWYHGQGYNVIAEQGEPSKQESAEVDMIKLPHLQVFCVLMRKTLKPLSL
jgi:GNAT superfamily N-acetyltransferase